MEHLSGNSLGMEEVKDSMFKQYREERIITKGAKVCQFINAKFKVYDILNKSVDKFDTLEEAIEFMV